jgi:hypothetical protein
MVVISATIQRTNTGNSLSEVPAGAYPARPERAGRASAAANTTYHTDAFAQIGDEADAQIRKIIEQNGPR